MLDSFSTNLSIIKCASYFAYTVNMSYCWYELHCETINLLMYDYDACILTLLHWVTSLFDLAFCRANSLSEAQS